MANPLCHFELMVDDPARARAFYSAVFDWSFDESSIPGYTLIQTGSEPSGGLFRRPAQAPGVCANVYFQTTDLDATLTKATQQGAKVLVPKTPIPNVGHFAMIADPEGIPIGLMQPN